ncbi:MAG: hypothetical protein HY000_32195 [Planctomycetes bacterium]|nr:hypothetical protein [Planctomycetota bacterium]
MQGKPTLKALDVEQRLGELRQLTDGWFDGKEGKALPSDGLDWFAQAFAVNYSERFVLPHLYPTVDGGIRAEWTFGPNELSLEIDLVSHDAQWHELNVKTDAEHARSLDLDVAESWKWIMKRLEVLGGRAE